MANRHLVEMRHPGVEKPDIVKAQVVAGVNPHSSAVSSFGCSHEWRNGCLGISRVKIGIRLGVKLYAISTGFGGEFNIVDLATHED